MSTETIVVPPNPWANLEFLTEHASTMSNAEMARTYGGTETSYRKWRKRFNLPQSPAIQSQPQSEVEPSGGDQQEIIRLQAELKQALEFTTEDKVERDRNVMRLRAELTELKANYKEALKTANVHEDVMEMARAEIARIRPVSVLPPKIGLGDTKEDAILFWADWHGGEVIDYDVMQGYNSYNPAIMCRRAQATVDTTLELLFDHHRGTTFETLYVFDMGDGVTGDLLDDNKATNAMTVFESIVFVADVKARALAELSAHIPVVYVGVPGNHGRRSLKMPWKQPSETADWLIYNMVKDRCEGLENVTVEVPKAWTVGVEARGFNFSLNHGYSAAKGGYGGIPWYSFQRADGKKTAMESAHGKRVDYRAYGHIHTPAELPKMDGKGSQFIIGTLAGGNEYALEELNVYGDPNQLLVGLHSTYGATWRYPLQVKYADDIPSRYECAIP